MESLGKNPIEDLQNYTDAMSLGIADKLFFMSRIKPDVIVDFGCADGMVLRAVHEMNPKCKLIGYDIDPQMVSKASARLKGIGHVTSDWNEVVEMVGGYQRPALILSSVIHEVYSYSATKDVKNFWEEKVFGPHFKYISIRDMIPSAKIERHEFRLFEKEVGRVRELADPYYLNSFEEKWGKIDSNYRTFIHFLLKYRYVDNWEREVNENYVPISIETLERKIPAGFKQTYKMSYIYYHLSEVIMKDFGIEIDHTTHLKMIIENKTFKKNNPL